MPNTAAHLMSNSVLYKILLLSVYDVRVRVKLKTTRCHFLRMAISRYLN